MAVFLGINADLDRKKIICRLSVFMQTEEPIGYRFSFLFLANRCWSHVIRARFVHISLDDVKEKIFRVKTELRVNCTPIWFWFIVLFNILMPGNETVFLIRSRKRSTIRSFLLCLSIFLHKLSGTKQAVLARDYADYAGMYLVKKRSRRGEPEMKQNPHWVRL